MPEEEREEYEWDDPWANVPEGWWCDECGAEHPYDCECE